MLGNGILVAIPCSDNDGDAYLGLIFNLVIKFYAELDLDICMVIFFKLKAILFLHVAIALQNRNIHACTLRIMNL